MDPLYMCHWSRCSCHGEAALYFLTGDKPCLLSENKPLPSISQEQWGIQLTMTVFLSAVLEAEQRLHRDKCTLPLSLNKPFLSYLWWPCRSTHSSTVSKHCASSRCPGSTRCWVGKEESEFLQLRDSYGWLRDKKESGGVHVIEEKAHVGDTFTWDTVGGD